MAGAGHTAVFDYVRTYRLRPGGWWSGPRVRDAQPDRRGRSPRAGGDPIDVREELPPR